MKIIASRPPNYEDIVAVFPEASSLSVVFCYGDTIFSPSGLVLPPEIIAHEGVHCGQQGTEDAGIRDWWKAYLTDGDFRLAQELPAHRAEYRCYKALHKDRNNASRYLHHVATKLASSLYGNLLNESQARKEIMK